MEEWQAQLFLFVWSAVYNFVHQDLETGGHGIWVGRNVHGSEWFLGASSDYYAYIVRIAQAIKEQWFVSVEVLVLFAFLGIPFILPLQCSEEQNQENWLRGIGFSPSKIKLTTA